MKQYKLTACIVILFVTCLFAASEDKRIQGIVEPFRSAEISPEISGRIVKIEVGEGKNASEGDTILKIEYTEDYLVAERARMAAENKADLKAARLKMETAKLEYDAIKLVYDSTSAVSEEELWSRKYQYEASLAQFEQLSGQKERELVEYHIAQARLKSHFIIAPYRCTIASIKLREHEHCGVSEPLVSIVDASKCRFITYVPINLVDKLTPGKTVKLQINGSNGLLYRNGVVEYLSPVVDPSSDLVTVKIQFENKDNSVKPGVSGYLLVGE